jgi:hypothetical protein
VTAPAPAPLRFTTSGPAVADGARLWQDVVIGFEHEVDADGVLHLTVDGSGDPVPRTHRLPLVVTARDAVEALGRVSVTLARHGTSLDGVAAGDYDVHAHEDVMLALITAMLGVDTVERIAADPTVAPDDFEQLMRALLDVWGFDTLLGDLFPGAEAAGTGPFPSAPATVSPPAVSPS